MLSECNAFIVAPSRVEAVQLEHMAERVGFGYIATTFAPETLHLGLTFFVLHYHLGEDAMRAVMEQVRNASDDDTRYAPVVLFTDDCPVERLLGYIRLGFDDVIALPGKRDVLEARLAAQFRAEQVYYQTGTYLGPDRRRMELPQQRNDRRTGVTPHSVLVIRRDPRLGIDVQRRRVIGQPLRPSPGSDTHQALRRPPMSGAVIRIH